jgi:hypothetical protein
MFRHRRPLRRWAARVLLLWLFGIGVGIANACVVPGPAMAVGPVAGAVEVVCPHHDGAGSQPADDHGNCRQFCDQERVSIRPLKTGLDDVQLHALALPASVVVLHVPAPAPVSRWVPSREGAAAPPPISIAFLRLTL